jgi:hypothetical protein
MQPQKRPNSDRSPETLAARLRALPAPPIPGGLEVRLLAAIPAEMPRGPGAFRPRRWAVWAGAAVAVAAACLLAVLWTRHETSGSGRQTIPSVPQPSTLASGPKAGSPAIVPWLQVRRGLDGVERETFTWPIQEKPPLLVSSSISPDLLD